MALVCLTGLELEFYIPTTNTKFYQRKSKVSGTEVKQTRVCSLDSELQKQTTTPKLYPYSIDWCMCFIQKSVDIEDTHTRGSRNYFGPGDFTTVTG